MVFDANSVDHPFADGDAKRLIIDGTYRDAISGRTFDSRNPANGELIATIPERSVEDVDLAVRAARHAFEEGPWGRMKPAERQRILLRFADLLETHDEDLARLDTLDMGMPLLRSLALVQRRAILMTRYYAGLATAIHGETVSNSMPGHFVSYTVREPVGVVGAIIPWNFPTAAAIWKIAPALATGCTVVLKPAEDASLSSLWLGQLLLEAGVPGGVVNVVTGYGETAGAALARHAGVDKIAFTGSSFTGQEIVRASAGNLKRVSLELGGKSPDIVFADANLDEAVPGVGMGVFANSGQICSAGTRLFVQESVYEEFVERIASYASGLRVGDGLDPETDVGPLVSKTQLARVSDYLQSGRDAGARIAAGGSQLIDGDFAKGYFIEPTVFGEVNDEMRIAREEIFGPVLSALSFKNPEELVKRANATNFGLASGVWTRDVSKAHALTRYIHAGTVWANCYGQMDADMPFGGYKMSGYGREGGIHHVDEFLNTKAVWIKTD